MYPVSLTGQSGRRCLRLSVSICAFRRRTLPAQRHPRLASAQSSSSSTVQQVGSHSGNPLFFDNHDQDHFPGSTGFFPKQHDQRQSEDDDGSKLVKDVEKLLDRRPREDFAKPEPHHNHVPRLFRNKLDLSYTDPQDPRAPSKAKQQSGASRPFFQHSYQVANSPFRISTTFRWATAAYIDHVIQGGDPAHAGWWKYGEITLDEALAIIFSAKNIAYLNARGYDAEDIVTWAWVLTATNTDHAIRRLNTVNEECLSQEKTEAPRWLVLQLLRTHHINAAAFASLVSDLLATTDRRPLLLDPPGPTYSSLGQGLKEDQIKGLWDYDSATLLIVRLLRHARRVCPTAFEDIAKLACRLLLPLHQHGSSGFERLAYACNRLLTLFALPAGERPFYSVAYQQRAQLALLKVMMQQSPQVPLNREGYRALIKVQLAHEKLDEEKVWSEAQGESWPPWSKAKLGIDERADYPGKESRAMKVLRRMLEAGYAHHTWERIAAVLAGWDTDKSPTIQTRNILRMARAAPLGEAFGEDVSPLIGELWSARITATRSVREAWACFNSYCKATDAMSRRYEPYHAMFTKLMARQQQVCQDIRVLPGDAKETFPDPASPRDLVYVDSQPPTVDALYQRMVMDGVKPVGRLLTDLTDQAETLTHGFAYLQDSGYSEVKKDVLLHADRYSRDQLRDTLSSIPAHFFSAFVTMLVRCGDRRDTASVELTIPSWFNHGRNDQSETSRPTGLNYALVLLFTSETKYLPAWNGMVRTLFAKMEERQPVSIRGFRRLNYRAWNVVSHLLQQEVDTDFTTFRIVVAMVHLRKGPSDSATSFPNLGFAEKAKVLFTRAVYKTLASWITEVNEQPVLTWPDPGDIRALIETLGIAGDLESLLDLVKWMQLHAKDLTTMGAHRRSAESLHTINTILIRIFLEALWVEDPALRLPHSMNQGKLKGTQQRSPEGFGWPSDEDVNALLNSWPAWLKSVRQAIAARRTRALKKDPAVVDIRYHAVDFVDEYS